MGLSAINKKKWRQILVVSFVSFVGGFFFSFAVGVENIAGMFQSGLIGIFIGGVTNTFEQFFADKFSRFNLLLSFILKSLIYSIIFLIALTGGFYFFFMDETVGLVRFVDVLLTSSFGYSFIFCIGMSVVIIFFLTISNLLGKGVLLKFILGRYHRPREEKKIFMFLDVKSSTTIAEKLGHLKFISFINDFFYDISSPVVSTQGEIYKYVGDEAIITWDFKKGLKKANCITCFFMIEESILKRKDYYLKRYGLMPEFKAGLHGGLVVAGEVGNFKKEITYMGDVLNTTARIEGECNTVKESLLISGELLDQIDVPDNLQTTDHKEMLLRGKENKLRLFGVNQKN